MKFVFILISTISSNTESHYLICPPELKIGDGTIESLDGTVIPLNHCYIEGIIRKVAGDTIENKLYLIKDYKLNVLVGDIRKAEGDSKYSLKDNLVSLSLHGVNMYKNSCHMFIKKNYGEKHEYIHGYSIRETTEHKNWLIEYLSKHENVAFRLEFVVSFHKKQDQTFSTETYIYEKEHKSFRRVNVLSLNQKDPKAVGKEQQSKDIVVSDYKANPGIFQGVKETPIQKETNHEKDQTSQEGFLYKHWKYFLFSGISFVLLTIFIVYYYKRV
ncbi:hypothetical protein CDIK_3466 [Cucumispora dikerogammari]|nr:hypothetical protein CDIK_3466 [Cucumispora dikerogammari]